MYKRIMIIIVFRFFICLSFVNCRNQNRLEPFVIEGVFSKIEDFPHSAYLVSYCGNRKTAVCGSSVLNQRVLITAAHCVPSKECDLNGHVKARFGSVNKRQGTEIEASKYLAHEDYSENELEGDIALVLLKKTVELTRNVARVAIIKEAIRNGEIATLAGWGFVDSSQTKTDLLKQVNQVIMTRTLCQEVVGDLPLGVFCASNNGQTPAGGDSGSALVIDHYLQVGLVSYALPTYRSYVVYTDVGYYYDWIRDNARNLFCLPETS